MSSSKPDPTSKPMSEEAKLAKAARVKEQGRIRGFRYLQRQREKKHQATLGDHPNREEILRKDIERKEKQWEYERRRFKRRTLAKFQLFVQIHRMTKDLQKKQESLIRRIEERIGTSLLSDSLKEIEDLKVAHLAELKELHPEIELLVVSISTIPEGTSKLAKEMGESAEDLLKELRQMIAEAEADQWVRKEESLQTMGEEEQMKMMETVETESMEMEREQFLKQICHVFNQFNKYLAEEETGVAQWPEESFE